MTESTDAEMVVAFTLDGDSYALSISNVQEIIRYTTPRGVASTEDWNRGVLSLDPPVGA